MRLKINREHAKQPINGWSFKESAFGITLKEDSLKEILERIIRFRISNMLPAGDPEHELAMQLSATHPHLVMKTESCIVRESREALEYMKWMTETWKSPPALSTDKEAIKARSETCRKCKWNDTDFYLDTFENKSRILKITGATTSDDGLGRCVIHGWHNLVGCRMRKTEKNEQQPSHCWAGEVPKL